MYTVRVQDECGRAQDVRVTGCNSCQQACNAALKRLPKGFRAIYALES